MGPMSHVERPGLAWPVAMDGLIVALCVLAAKPHIREQVAERFSIELRAQTVHRVLALLVALRITQALGGAVYARRNGLGSAASRWALNALMMGWPSTRLLVGAVRAARSIGDDDEAAA